MLDVLGAASRSAMPQSNPMTMMSQLRQMVGMLKGQNPQQMAQMMAQRNPQFAAFMRQNQGKTVEQIAADYGIDMGFVQELMR